MDKNVKAMLKISDVLDDRYKKLCDRYHDLELSHNRKVCLLKRAAELLSYISTTDDMVQEVHYLYLAILADLNYPLCRVYERRKK